MLEAREMLRSWENKDPEVRGLWEMMNNWVYVYAAVVDYIGRYYTVAACLEYLRQAVA